MCLIVCNLARHPIRSCSLSVDKRAWSSSAAAVGSPEDRVVVLTPRRFGYTAAGAWNTYSSACRVRCTLSAWTVVADAQSVPCVAHDQARRRSAHRTRTVDHGVGGVALMIGGGDALLVCLAQWRCEPWMARYWWEHSEHSEHSGDDGQQARTCARKQKHASVSCTPADDNKLRCCAPAANVRATFPHMHR